MKSGTWHLWNYITTDEVGLVVVLYFIGMEDNYSPSLLLTYPILATKTTIQAVAFIHAAP